MEFTSCPVGRLIPNTKCNVLLTHVSIAIVLNAVLQDVTGIIRMTLDLDTASRGMAAG